MALKNEEEWKTESRLVNPYQQNHLVRSAPLKKGFFDFDSFRFWILIFLLCGPTKAYQVIESAISVAWFLKVATSMNMLNEEHPPVITI
ncbi:hypothetical protein WN943_005660 [Citrus x changshan-huyou]